MKIFRRTLFFFLVLCLLPFPYSWGQTASRADEIRELRQELASLNARLTKLENEEAASTAPSSDPAGNAAALSAASEALSAKPVEPAPQNLLTTADRNNRDFLNGTTFTMGLDGYYEYNFNDPIGRTNLLRAYDVSSNAFALNQANFIIEHAPDPDHGKRFGARLDLQFGQATQSLQGNPANEPRSSIYRNLFQAYGTYVAPVGKGLTLDFGKWASSLGIEGTYTKDQMNYSRSYWFGFLPSYHMGVRANYAFASWLAARYATVNGIQQTEAFNGFKDQMFGIDIKPRKSVGWSINYYLGQEHPDFQYVTNGSSGLPTQQGMPFEPIPNAPKGKIHIFDSYVTWNASPKLAFVLEGDYAISRDQTWSAPQHVDGAALYARYQFNPQFAIAGRTEYFSDPNALYTGKSQALKEFTITFDHALANGFLMREEFRHDFSNQPYFLTDTLGKFKNDQTTATVGLLWWFGGKQEAW
jgi:hypothetical protein